MAEKRKTKRRRTKAVREDYVPPYTECYATEFCQLLTVSGDHLRGDLEGEGESDHVQGYLDPGGGRVGIEAKASVNIHGVEFSFSDLWEN